MENKLKMNIQELMNEFHATAVDKGWWEQERNLGETMFLINTELSEAFEEWRNGKGLAEIYYSAEGKPEGVPVEIADAIVRILDMCAGFGIPIVEALQIKKEYNKTRPYRHGGKKA